MRPTANATCGLHACGVADGNDGGWRGVSDAIEIGRGRRRVRAAAALPAPPSSVPLEGGPLRSGARTRRRLGRAGATVGALRVLLSALEREKGGKNTARRRRLRRTGAVPRQFAYRTRAPARAARRTCAREGATAETGVVGGGRGEGRTGAAGAARRTGRALVIHVSAEAPHPQARPPSSARGAQGPRRRRRRRRRSGR